MKNTEIDKMRRRCGAEILTILNEKEFKHISYNEISQRLKISSDQLQLLFTNLEQMLAEGIRHHDDAVLAGLAESFGHEDSEVKVDEKILEGLITYLEAYTPYQQAIINLKASAIRNPRLAIFAGQRLFAFATTLLHLAGVETKGIKGKLAVEGIVGVLLISQSEWMRDDSPDLSPTIRVLDKRLERLKELGQMLSMIPAGNSEESNDLHEKKGTGDD